MKTGISIFLFALVLVSSLFSCKNKGVDNKNNNIDTLLAKTIVFPNTLLKLDGIEFKKINSFKKEIKNKRKIISIIDGNCPKCIVNLLNETDSIFNNILFDDENVLIFILNVSKKDSAFFMRNLQPEINAYGTILWDNNYNFESQNKLFTSDINLRTFMVNEENKIIQYGNPILNPDVIYEYQEKIEMNISTHK